MMVMWAIFRGSWALQALTVAAIAWGAWKTNGALKFHAGKEAGKTEVVEAVTKKADDNAKTADAVRDAAAAGKRGGVLDPYIRRGPGE